MGRVGTMADYRQQGSPQSLEKAKEGVVLWSLQRTFHCKAKAPPLLKGPAWGEHWTAVLLK